MSRRIAVLCGALTASLMLALAGATPDRGDRISPAPAPRSPGVTPGHPTWQVPSGRVGSGLGWGFQ